MTVRPILYVYGRTESAYLFVKYASGGYVSGEDFGKHASVRAWRTEHIKQTIALSYCTP